jgi:hypothetical protein
VVPFARHTVARVRVLQERIRVAAAACTSTDQAAQRLADILFSEVADIALVRVYAALPFDILPPPVQEKAVARARLRQVEHLISARTPVMSLLGSRGIERSWGDRRLSQSHAGVPLVSPEFLESLPMFSALLSDLGSSLIPRPAIEGVHLESLLGGDRAGLFFVEDAASTLDARGRRIIPSQDFVASYGIKTVFGMGAMWTTGEFLTCIVFSTVAIERAIVRRLAPLLGVFRSASNSLAVKGSFFAEG